MAYLTDDGRYIDQSEGESDSNALRNALIATLLGAAAFHPLARAGLGGLAGLGVRGAKAAGRGAKKLRPANVREALRRGREAAGGVGEGVRNNAAAVAGEARGFGRRLREAVDPGTLIPDELF